MFAEILLTGDDFTQALNEALPLTIHLGDEGKEQLKLFDLESVEIHPKGLRVMCKADVVWPVLGVQVPVTLHELVILLTPSIAKGPEGDKLLFGLRIEHADVEILPDFLDNKVTEIVNAALEKKDLDLAWDFSKSLALAPKLPTQIVEPLDKFALKPAWGKVRIVENAIILAVSFHFKITRIGEEVPPELQAAEDRPLDAMDPSGGNETKP